MERFIAVTDRLPDKPGKYWAYHYYQDLWAFIEWDGTEWQRGYNITHWTSASEKPSTKPSGYTSVLIKQGKARKI